MSTPTRFFALAILLAGSTHAQAMADTADPRLQQVLYAPDNVVELPVQRGTVTHIELADDEAITAVATGLGSDCAKPESSWCIAAQPGDRHVFVKPRSTATAHNNLAIVTNQRTHAFRLTVLAPGDKRQAVYRMQLRLPPPKPARPVAVAAAPLELPPPPPAPKIDEAKLVTQRLAAAPEVVNTAYSIAEGQASADIVPTLVFDDGRFTYLRFPNNREVPAVFHVLGDGGETLVNTRMEGDLLVVDRISRRLTLRAGSAVVGLWNDGFDLDGAAPRHGTTVAGVKRVIRSAASAPQSPAEADAQELAP